MNEQDLSITELMGLLKAGEDEIIGKGVTFIEEAEEQLPVKPVALHGRCDECETPLEYERPEKADRHHPQINGGYYCHECRTWT